MPARLLTLIACLFLSAPVLPQDVYTDPAGSYRLAVPAGWQVQAQGGGVSLLNGPAYASLLTVGGRGAPAGLVEAIANNFLSQWQHFEGASSGAARFAGREGAYAWYTGANPRGVEAVVKIVATVAGDTGYVLMYSAPRADFGGFKADFERIEASVELPNVP